MTLWIEHPIEPSQLLLAWQAPDGQPDRRRWTVGRVLTNHGQVSFEYFDEEELSVRNFGRGLTALRAAGFVGYPAFAYEPGRVVSTAVIETLLRRLPPQSRADFGRYQEYFSIAAGSVMSPITLLALTEARLPSDGFSLIDPFDPSVDDCDVVFEIAGFRYEANRPILSVGQELILRAEPDNEHDPAALAVFISTGRIGYVNRLQAGSVAEWLKTRDCACTLIRLNGKAGAPRAYARLRVRPAKRRLAA